LGKKLFSCPQLASDIILKDLPRQNFLQAGCVIRWCDALPTRVIFYFCAGASAIGAIEYPSPPQAPTLNEPKVEGATTRTKKTATPVKTVPQATMRLRIHLGDKSVLLAEAALPATYAFTHKKGHIQYNQTVRVEEIRELVVENYRARKVAGAKDGDTYEFEPSTVRIELKDGQVFKLNYLFKELRKIRAKNADGAFSVFAFFADTWRQRGGWQERTDEDFKLTSRRAHPAAYVKLEYFEPVDKAGAGKADSSPADK